MSSSLTYGTATVGGLLSHGCRLHHTQSSTREISRFPSFIRCNHAFWCPDVLVSHTRSFGILRSSKLPSLCIMAHSARLPGSFDAVLVCQITLFELSLTSKL